MKAYFVDLDGTFFLHGTNELAPGAKKFAEQIKRSGDKLYFVTARHANNIPEELNIESTRRFLSNYKITYQDIINDCPSPRILINDEGCVAVNISTNSGLFDTRDHSISLTERIYNSLTAMAWVNAKYGDDRDADDFVQTIIVAESLLASNGFCHKHLVSCMRKIPQITMNNKILEKAGVKSSYKGQISKLLNSSDPLFAAIDGVSDGAAMRTLGIGAMYRNKHDELVSNSIKIASVTHGSIEAKLSSLLTSLRYAQLFTGDIAVSPLVLYEKFKIAANLLFPQEKTKYFLTQTYKAARFACRIQDPMKLLRLLAKHIGITHLAWGTPIAAVFWSFHASTDFSRFFKGYSSREIYVGDNDDYNPRLKTDEMAINLNSFSKKQKVLEVRHLKKIGEFDDFKKCHKHHYGFLDIDTFFSISISMLAARNGISGIFPELQRYNSVFNVDMLAMATFLSEAGMDIKYQFNAHDIYK